MRDILIEKKADIFDIAFKDGDFTLTEGLDSSIIASLFVDQRAEPSEVSSPELRRGWIGNEQNDDPTYQIGSKLWLLYQARSTQTTLNAAISFASNCFQWLISDQFIKSIEVSGIQDGSKITLTVVFVRFDDTSFTRQFVLWENTSIA